MPSAGRLSGAGERRQGEVPAPIKGYGRLRGLAARGMVPLGARRPDALLPTPNATGLQGASPSPAARLVSLSKWAAHSCRRRILCAPFARIRRAEVGWDLTTSLISAVKCQGHLAGHLTWQRVSARSCRCAVFETATPGWIALRLH